MPAELVDPLAGLGHIAQRSVQNLSLKPARLRHAGLAGQAGAAVHHQGLVATDEDGGPDGDAVVGDGIKTELCGAGQAQPRPRSLVHLQVLSLPRIEPAHSSLLTAVCSRFALLSQFSSSSM